MWTLPSAARAVSEWRGGAEPLLSEKQISLLMATLHSQGRGAEAPTAHYVDWKWVKMIYSPSNIEKTTTEASDGFPVPKLPSVSGRKKKTHSTRKYTCKKRKKQRKMGLSVVNCKGNQVKFKI